MFKYIFFFSLFCIINFSSFAEEDQLTLKQKIDRLQRDVNDLSKIVSKIDPNAKITSQDTSNSINISAFDMRIYDLEKDIKSLNSNLENLIFEIDEIKKSFEEMNIKLNDEILDIGKKSDNVEVSQEDSQNTDLPENSLGTLKITSKDLSEDYEGISSTSIEKNSEIILKPDEQFQIAFDLLRAQKFDQAKAALNDFIKNNEDNDLSGSAHYWLGEIHLLKKEYRDAALIFAEGYQKYPQSIKAPDSLFKLSEALVKIDKSIEACNTLDKFLKDHPTHKLIKKINSKIQELNCN